MQKIHDDVERRLSQVYLEKLNPEKEDKLNT